MIALLVLIIGMMVGAIVWYIALLLKGVTPKDALFGFGVWTCVIGLVSLLVHWASLIL